MWNMNTTTVKETYKSYIKALEKLWKRWFVNLSRCGSGYTHYLWEEFESRSNNLAEADEVYIRNDDLFEYGRPKIIEKSWWIYKDSFLKIRFTAIEKYITTTIWERYENNIRIEFADIWIGIWNFEESKKKLLEDIKDCNPQVKEKIIKALEDSENRLNQWREKIREQLESIV